MSSSENNNNITKMASGFVANLVKGIMARVVERQIFNELQDVAKRNDQSVTKTRLTPTDAEAFPTMVEIMKQHKGQVIRVRLYGDNDIVLDAEYTVPKVGFKKWFDEIGYDFTMDDSGDTRLLTADFERAYVIVTRGSAIAPTAISQAFAEGATNCVLKPIKAWIEERIANSKSHSVKSRWATKNNRIDKYEKEFPNGIPGKNMQEICDYFNIDITIDLPLTNEYLKYKYQKKALAHFNI